MSKVAEVIDLLLQLDKLMLMLMSCCLSMLDSVEGVDAGGQTQAHVCSTGCKWRGMLLFEVCYVLLQLTVRLLVGVHFMLHLSELPVCSRVDGYASCRMCMRTCLGMSVGTVHMCVMCAITQLSVGAGQAA